MLTIEYKNLFKNIAFCLFVTMLVQLMFTISFTQQKPAGLVNSNNNANGDSSSNDVSERIEPRSLEQKTNKLTLSPEMIYLLMKRFQHNQKLQEYLTVLKKKKFDESYGEENQYDDETYEGKFRF